MGIKASTPMSSSKISLAKEILFDDFQKKIRNCFLSNDKIPATRKNIIQLLDTLVSSLDHILYVNQKSQSGDEYYIAEHPTVTLLAELSDLFRDLDNGKTCEVFRPNPYGATASLSLSEQREHELLATALLIAQRAYEQPTKMATAVLVAKKLNKAGWKRRNGTKYTADFIRKLPHRNRKQIPIKR